MKYLKLNDWAVLNLKSHPWHLQVFKVDEVHKTRDGANYILKYGKRLVTCNDSEVEPISRLNSLLKKECGKCPY